MNEIIYGLCVITSLLCAALLLRAFRRTGFQLLFWSAMCFVLFSVSNVLVIFDVYIVPNVNLFFPRSMLTFAGVAVLLYGLIWEAT